MNTFSKNLIYSVACACFCFFLTGNTSFAAGSKAHIFELVYNGKFDESRGELAKFNPEEYETHFLEGLIAKRQNKLDEAEALFRKSLAENPKFAPAKRELAHTLFLMGNYEGSKLHFEELASTEGNQINRDSYNQFIEAIKSKRPWGFTGYIGIAPSSNANRGSNRKYYVTEFGKFKISEDSKSQSGVGVSLGGSFFYRKSLTQKSNLLFTGNINSRIFRNDEFNSHYGSFNLEYGRKIGQGNYYIGITTRIAAQEWDTSNYVGYGVSFRGVYQIDYKRLFSFSLLALRQDDRDSGIKDGNRYSASLDYRMQLSPINTISLGGKYEQERTTKAHLDHNDYQFRTFLSHRWQGGLENNFGFSYERKQYEGNFPASNEPRQDDRLIGSVSFLHTGLSFKGFTPKATYTYTSNQSNIEFYEYDAHDVGVILTKKF